MAKCPICDATVKPRTENTSFPFCGARCKMIDLGKWLSEDYRVPIEEQDSEVEDDEGGGAEGGGSGSKTEKTVRH